MEHAVSKNRKTKGIPFAIVNETVHGFHCGIIAIAITERSIHGTGDINTKLDVGHLSRRAGLLKLPGAGEQHDGEG